MLKNLDLERNSTPSRDPCPSPTTHRTRRGQKHSGGEVISPTLVDSPETDAPPGKRQPLRCRWGDADDRGVPFYLPGLALLSRTLSESQDSEWLFLFPEAARSELPRAEMSSERHIAQKMLDARFLGRWVLSSRLSRLRPSHVRAVTVVFVVDG